MDACRGRDAGDGHGRRNIPAVGALRLTEVHPMADKKEAFAEVCERTAPAEASTSSIRPHRSCRNSVSACRS